MYLHKQNENINLFQESRYGLESTMQTKICEVDTDFFYICILDTSITFE